MSVVETGKIHDDLRKNQGSDIVIRHKIAKALYFTEGVKAMRESCSAYWLVDAIASYYLPGHVSVRNADERFREMHFWTLRPIGDKAAILSAAVDSGEPDYITQEIEYTDFPFDVIDGVKQEFKLFASETMLPNPQTGNFVMAWLLLLPSEY